MTQSIRHVVILGGGSAGWLTAGVLAAEHGGPGADDLRITVIESPDVPIIGVGEGTWPTMRDTLRRIGVSEADFIRECEGAFKQGSQFVNWTDAGPNDTYYHPFHLPGGYDEADLIGGWRQHHPDAQFDHLVCAQPHLCDANKGPKQFATPEYASVANYAYHLDAAKLGGFLRKHCVARLNVRHVPDLVTEVLSHDNGDIAALRTREHGDIAGDLFIDCTGLRALLIGQHLGEPLLPQQHLLFNDRAIPTQVAYADPRAPIACQTISTAQKFGWIWDIGLQGRRGIGHVYSSAYGSEQDAHDALVRYIVETGGREQDITWVPRVRIEPGYRLRPWRNNCVAVGLSSGFLEPLEASSLVLVELAAAMIADQFPATRDTMDILAGRFNDTFRYRWERVVDFLKLHYVLSRRDDSDYWRDHRREESWPERLRDLLSLWRYQPPSRYDLYRIEEVFPWASYQYILYGMGFVPQGRVGTAHTAAIQRAERCFRQTAEQTARMLAALPGHRELIDHIRARGLPRV
ncbi:tryptophan halogenase [Stenotrophomonas panacihumi]|uniref:Tryptophan halogenase n=1 Tax=Stenotrophomonas panacihumi TaxID=676599 RepID=A0A0R0AEB7_9GAMM|nr:tryptophan halogenase family protein [Stenotrophomonas panacihumi]KRG43292.1 tryptophan halogenase [Stenotrophomonas panacihumi]PTN55650.1 tryptophan 7-halogenase [Stenotrophomonas panacihumi]